MEFMKFRRLPPGPLLCMHWKPIIECTDERCRRIVGKIVLWDESRAHAPTDSEGAE